MLKLAKGASVYRNRITLHEYTLSQLFRELKKPDIRKKKDGPYFVLAEFTDLAKPVQGDKYPYSIRNSENLIKYYGAVIDLDDAQLELKEVGPLLPECKYFLYTTFSHQLSSRYNEKGLDPQNRYRLIIPYDQPVSPDTHKMLIAYIGSCIGIENLDISTDAISRPMYLPAMHPSNRSSFDYDLRTKASLLRTTLTAQEKFEISELIEESGQDDQKKFDINEEIYEGEGRNDAACKIVGKFIANGMDNETVVRAVEAWNEVNCKPPLRRKELHTVIKSIVDGHGKRSGKWGFDELERQVKKTTSDDFEQTLKIIASADRGSITVAKREILLRDMARRLKIPISAIRDELKKHELLEEEVETAEEEKKERLTVKELRQEFKEWVYVSSLDRVYHLKKGILYKTEGFNRMHQNKLEKGTVLPLLLKYNCIQQADRLEFAPSEKKIFTRNFAVFANTYRKPELQPVYDSVKPMLDHLRMLIPDYYERNIILDYIAYLVQHPGKKILFMPIIKGGKGVGKSVIAEKIIPAVLGEQNVRAVKPRKVNADFNAWQLDTQLVVFHELKLGTTRQEKLNLTEELKEIITDHGMQASRKTVDDYDVRNFLNLFAFTNHEDAIMITPDERRFYMIRSEMQLQDDEYYDKLHTWLDDNIEAIYHYFLYRDLEDFNPYRLPYSKYTEEIKEQSYMWPQSIVMDALGDSVSWLNQDVAVSWRAIVNYIRDKSAGRDAMECDNLTYAMSSQSYKLVNALKDCGFRKYTMLSGNSRMRVNGSLETIWLTPKGVDLYNRKMLRKAAVKKCVTTQKQIFDFEGE